MWRISTKSASSFAYLSQVPALISVEFGKFEDSFKVLQQKGEKIEILVFVEDVIKLLRPQALCF